jgi:flagellar hook-length control protein FliK
MSITANIPSKISAPRQEVDLVKDLQRGADTPQFDQVMNLVQPKVAKEAVKAYESHAQERSRIDADRASSKHVRDDQIVRSEKSANQSEEATTDVNAAATPEAVQMAGAELEGQRSKVLKLVSQLSQDDLLSIIEWRGDLSLQAGALDTQLNIDHLPKVEGITTSDMMALLNGFKQLEIPADQLPSLEGPQLAQWLEAQWDASKISSAQRHMMMGALGDFSQQQTANSTSTAMMSMEAVARPSEVMPALNLLKLSQGQKEGILKQVAHGYKTQRGGTQTVNIRLHPEELGAVRLKVEVQGQEVRVFFSAENAAVADLISQNLDDLRALLLEQDFDLTEAGLFNDQLNQGEGQQDEEQGEDYGSDDRPDLQKRPKNSPRLSPLPGRFRATV